jgi:hypothetical protein
MADDELTDDDELEDLGDVVDEESEEEFAEEEFSEEDFDEEVFDDDALAGDEDLAVEVIDEEEEETGPRPVARKAAGDDEEDDDDDVLDPDDIEADLEEILRDRIAAADDEEDEEEEEAPLPSERTVGSVAPKRADEWTCPGCFLIVSASQFGSRDNPTCPSGEDPCPSLERL